MFNRFIYVRKKWKEAVGVIKKMLRTRCGNRIVVSEQDIEELQQEHLLLGEGHEEIANIWKELCDRCPSVDATSASTTNTSTEQQFVFSEHLKDNTNPTNDICVAFSPNGDDIAW